MHGYRTGIILALTLALAATFASAGDAVTEAKRKAANDLMKEGKTADAIAMIGEVIKVDPENYKDHLLLARAYDKLNKSQEAVDAYRHVLDLPGGNDDRAVKAEVERRLKVLDAQSAKIQTLEDEILKKLDVLEREAIAAKDMRALQHVFALRGAIWNARGRKEGFGVDLPATAEWLDGGGIVKKGTKYHVRVAGYWTISGVGQCTADGFDTVPPPNPQGKYGIILGAVEGGGRYEKITTDCTFVAPATGRMTFVSNVKTREERDKCTGRLYLLVQPIGYDETLRPR